MTAAHQERGSIRTASGDGSPAEVLDRLPEDLIKIPKQAAADDPVCRSYRWPPT
jgi:hypothetical protein